jgi:hypothetical protein
VIAFVLLPLLILGGGGFAYQAQMKARAPRAEAAPPSATEQPVQPPPLSAEPPPPPTFTPESPSASASGKKKPAGGPGAVGTGAAAEANADPSKTGVIDTTAVPAGRKVIIDGRQVGTSGRRYVIRCGMHRIQIGDLEPENIGLPCGGEVSFSD